MAGPSGVRSLPSSDGTAATARVSNPDDSQSLSGSHFTTMCVLLLLQDSQTIAMTVNLHYMPS